MRWLLAGTLLVLGLVVPSTSQAGDDLFAIAGSPVYSPRYTVSKFGVNTDIDDTEESLWDLDDIVASGTGPDRCFTVMGTTPAALYISSSDESDASDGAKPISVTIEALDSTWAPVTIVTALGAASAGGSVFKQVGSVTLLRINRMYVSGVNPALGNIFVGTDPTDGGTDGIPETPSLAGALVAGISIGENQTLQACYTVPLGYNAYMTSWAISNEGTGATTLVTRIRKSTNGATSRTQMKMTLSDGDVHDHHGVFPTVFPEKTDIELTGSGATSQDAAGLFDMVLISNTLSGL